ncbi:FUSC family protein [Kerstersia gyiorum]|uniref:FUSC family protein n=1 Tax=Kerstersia gyiorum TaxID=206506 RepID=UPI00209FC2A3|nr:FUSC family protein [Kerstersia gyiorum]MCP1633374.1 putative membrane protein YccC [Kerstersia gyiorum]MCP1681957.1 putative membrane protein YccC [Kerstersia gyiorum]MCP1717625.1 putative membrane protein YccC [Kerstersia gyiorum]MCW2186477.1 putative membrane protein YccC [Kerstersia gyiorum]
MSQQLASPASASPRLSRPVQWLDRCAGQFWLFTPRNGYILRSTLAAALALVVAYLLDLEMPYSAASTVLLVINPVQGAVIGKGAWRIIGTIAGMLVAFILMSVAGQMPLLFLLGFGCWLGLCVAGMTLLRHFRASGVVVAGYTIGLATYGAMGHPEATFEHVMGRGSTVVIGVMCLGLVTALMSRRSVRGRLAALYAKLAGNAAGAIASQHGDATAAATRRLGVLGDIYALDDLLAVGKAESEELAQRAAGVRHGMASLFGALAGGAMPLAADSASAKAVQRLQAPLQQAWEQAAARLEQGAEGAGAARTLLLQARRQFISALQDTDLHHPAQEAALLIAADRLLEQLDAYLGALAGLSALSSRPVQGRLAPVRFHRDWGGALRNGVRSMLAIVLAGLFWLQTGWSYGDMMLLVLAPYCALLATAGNPAAGAWQFVKGTIWAVPAAFVCSFLIFPLLDGLPLLLLTLALFWLPGIHATSVPHRALAGLAYLVAFNTLAAAGNPMHYGLLDFLNFSAAWILATLFVVLVFQLILPRNPARDQIRLRHAIRDDSLALLRGRGAMAQAWQQRQQHRIAQLGAQLKGHPELMLQAVSDAIAALHTGREVLRIRHQLRHAALPATARKQVHNGLAKMARTARSARPPSRCAIHARRCARQLAALLAHCPVTARRDVQRALAAFTDMDALLRRHAAYFDTTS